MLSETVPRKLFEKTDVEYEMISLERKKDGRWVYTIDLTADLTLPDGRVISATRQIMMPCRQKGFRNSGEVNSRRRPAK